MTVYLDSSVVLRRLQGESKALQTWARWQRAYSSALLRVEVLRTIDRNRLRGMLKDREVAELAAGANAIFDTVQLVSLSPSILSRAAQSFLTPLGTLDALHLATALRLVETRPTELVFLTHDSALALAARSLNFEVHGA